jgi:periodic tryptophan protein 2
LLAGGNSKYVCLYDVAQKLLIKKFSISSNKSLDGVLEFLNSKHLTEAAFVVADPTTESPEDILIHRTAPKPIRSRHQRAEEEITYLPGSKRGDPAKRVTRPAIR